MVIYYKILNILLYPINIPSNTLSIYTILPLCSHYSHCFKPRPPHGSQVGLLSSLGQWIGQGRHEGRAVDQDQGDATHLPCNHVTSCATMGMGNHRKTREKWWFNEIYITVLQWENHRKYLGSNPHRVFCWATVEK